MGTGEHGAEPGGCRAGAGWGPGRGGGGLPCPVGYSEAGC